MLLIMLKSGVKNQCGISDVVVMGIALPVLILLLAGVADLARVPVAKNRLHTALFVAAFGAEEYAAGQNDGPLLDIFTPAGNNLCDKIYPPGSCTTDGLGARAGFFSMEVAKALVQAACELGRKILKEDASMIFNYDIERDGGLQFGLVRLSAGALNGELDADPQLIALSDGCGTAFSKEDIGGLDALLIAKRMRQGFAELGAGAGAWKIQDAFDVSDPAKWLNERKQWLSSYWLVGIGHIKIKFLMGNFFGESRTVVDYFIRPFTVPAGIQKGS